MAHIGTVNQCCCPVRPDVDEFGTQVQFSRVEGVLPLHLAKAPLDAAR
jgi:hypothetical protein